MAWGTVKAARAASAGLAVCAFAGAGHAQDEDAFDLGTLQLEGTKLDREYVDTASSVSVLDPERIEQTGATDLKDTFDLMGNVTDSEGGESLFTIRGLSAEGVTESQNASPLTSMVIDGVGQSILSMRRGARGLWDVQQVEVYRGPQSALQGRGALAGAVVVESKDPTFTPEYDFRAIYGSQNRQEAAFALSGPVIEDQLAIRLSGEARERKRGVSYNLPSTEIFGEDKYRSLRFKMLYEPFWAPNLSFKLTLNDVYDRPGQSVSNAANYFDRQYNSSATSAVEAREAESQSASFQVEYDFGNDMVLTSVTAYLDAQTRIFTPTGNAYFRDTQWQDKNLTQDVRLTFGSEEARFSGVVGLFFGRYEQPRNDLIELRLPGAPTQVLQDIVAADETRHVSIYTDLDWQFAPKFTFNFGGRLLREKVTDIQTNVGNLVTPGTFSAVTSDTVFVPHLGLTYDITEDQTISASLRRGYRSGFNSIQGTNISQVKPEYLTSAEIAYRIEDPAGFWRFGANAFYSRYTDQQVSVGMPPTTIPRTVNAGKSEMYGLELEGQYAFGNGISVFGSVGLLRTKFLEFSDSGQVYTGNQFPGAPRLTAGLGVAYENPNGWFASATASYSSSYFSPYTLDNDPAQKVDGYTHVDMQVGKRFGNAEIAFYVDNVLDSDYLTSLSCSGGSCEAVVSEPRTIGIELRARF